MIIERIWAATPLRNFHYLLGCEHTGEALVIDPLNWQGCLARASELGWRIRQIVSTHEHEDHTGGNAALVAATGAQVLAPVNAAARIGGVNRGLCDGDIIRVGQGVELTCLDTPGHTLTHVCLYAQANGDDGPALFSGDTLFNAGVGNCIRGGDPDRLYETVSGRLSALPATTRLYPGHEYFARNLAFTLDREPSNAAAHAWLARCEHEPPQRMPLTTLGEERAINVFFRLDQPEIIERLRPLQPQWPEQPTARAVFLALRELRNRW